MVLYFAPQGHEQGSNDWLIYMGKDKFENEDLIKYGWTEDVWFHVDNMSSAHVYLRLPKGATLDDIPPETLDDCCQLVKQNSIQGCKENNVDIVYTLWKNLKKTASMEVGQIGFHKQKEVRKYRVEKKKNDTINRLNKTRTEAFPDLAKLREQHDRELTEEKKRDIVAKKAQEKKEAEAKRREAELLSYDRLQDKEAMESNKDLASKYASVEDYEDDFM